MGSQQAPAVIQTCPPESSGLHQGGQHELITDPRRKYHISTTELFQKASF